jgi:hypothetical protein
MGAFSHVNSNCDESWARKAGGRSIFQAVVKNKQKHINKCAK